MSYERESFESSSSSATLDTPEKPDILDTRSAVVAPSTLPTEHVVDDSIALPHPKSLKERFTRGVSWPITIWMMAMHIAALAAFFYFSWSGLAIALVLHWVTCCLGVTLGYHRLLTHGSFVVSKPVKYFFSLCGMMSAEGSPMQWVAIHRKHHAHSDLEGDPHSPNEGFWWSHMLWFLPYDTPEQNDAMYRRWAPDLYKDPVYHLFQKTFILVSVALGAVLYAAGEYFYGLGMSWLLWGLCLRLVLAYHSTWFVNSATHIWGYRNYTTTDRSRNLWWVAVLSYGEGWHNNHHAHQRLAVHGHRWWEIDVTWNVIRLLRVLGLATKVQDRIPQNG
ncbi:MAG: fatty acid desaturase [Planctomycetota bacterium]|nr:fatty acid desaturase [Planctomycetota bacterium]